MSQQSKRNRKPKSNEINLRGADMNKLKESHFLSYMGQILCVYSEKIEGKGEDAYLCLANEKGALIGCFDGCGGIGSRRYEVFDTHTGAYVASRVTAEAAADWFLRGCEKDEQDIIISRLSPEELSAEIREALKACKRAEKSSSALKGSLTKDFPTTLAIAVAGMEGASFYWAGDSRAYILDEAGLHQMTTDDVEQKDAMKNLSDDGALKNVVSASRSFQIHQRETALGAREILLVCTDGCFGYLDSPMAFEMLLLETMERAQNPVEWENLLKERIGQYAGDDYTLMAMILGYEDFKQIKQCFKDRIEQMREGYRKQQGKDNLSDWWKEYKKEYESYRGVYYGGDN
ncbi:MAG: hypothetical protein EOM40_03330 [Clostridia bacterium]|nr:hypothetical protein [Clostridia bacterium]NCC43259.1 hypothetical protein [Clostridia bacterium]